jgi:hypothetical protein
VSEVLAKYDNQILAFFRDYYPQKKVRRSPLMHYCTAALLHCCTAALLHCCTAALLH